LRGLDPRIQALAFIVEPESYLWATVLDARLKAGQDGGKICTFHLNPERRGGFAEPLVQANMWAELFRWWLAVPYYIYEIPSRKYREERNWPDEKQARSALKHVARRAVQEGASNEEEVFIVEKSSSEKIYTGTLGAAAKGAASQ
jgi:hypothetical protein